MDLLIDFNHFDPNLDIQILKGFVCFFLKRNGEFLYFICHHLEISHNIVKSILILQFVQKD